MKTRKLLSILIAFIMVLGIMPCVALTAFATGEEVTEEEVDSNGPVTISNGDYSLTVNKTQYEVGEPILVSGSVVSSTDWIGIYDPRGTGSIRYDYPSNYGAGVEFDIRQSAYDNGNTELATIPEGEYIIIRLMPNDVSVHSQAKGLVKIRVGDPPAISGDSTRLSLQKRVFTSGEPIMVSAVGSGTDWVGIVSSGLTQSAKYHYVTDAGSGVYYDVTRGTSFSPGSYTIALVPDNGTYKDSELIAYTNIIITDEYNYAVEYEETTTPDEGDDSGTTDPDAGGTDTPEIPEEQTSYFTIEKTEYLVGEPIYVTAYGVDKDWVGLFSGNSYLDNAWYYIVYGNSAVGSGVTCDVTKGNTIPAGTYTLAIVSGGSSNLSDAYQTVEITIREESDIPKAPSSATYEIDDIEGGYAKGTISVTMPSDELDNRSIVMYWANENGKLEGYPPLSLYHPKPKSAPENGSALFF